MSKSDLHCSEDGAFLELTTGPGRYRCPLIQGVWVEIPPELPTLLCPECGGEVFDPLLDAPIEAALRKEAQAWFVGLVREVRLKYRISQFELENLLHIPRPTFQAMLNGRDRPSAQVCTRLLIFRDSPANSVQYLHNLRTKPRPEGPKGSPMSATTRILNFRLDTPSYIQLVNLALLTGGTLAETVSDLIQRKVDPRDRAFPIPYLPGLAPEGPTCHIYRTRQEPRQYTVDYSEYGNSMVCPGWEEVIRIVHPDADRITGGILEVFFPFGCESCASETKQLKTWLDFQVEAAHNSENPVTEPWKG